jgi:hypothetical protein
MKRVWTIPTVRDWIIAGAVIEAATLSVPWTTSAPRMFPRLVEFHGGVLGDQRCFITDHQDVMRFFEAVSSSPSAATSRDVQSSPFLESALYWFNPLWEPYIADPASLKDLPFPSVTPWRLPPPGSEKSYFVQPARLYLGDNKSAPAFDQAPAERGSGLRSIAPAGLEILRKHGIPTHTLSPDIGLQPTARGSSCARS